MSNEIFLNHLGANLTPTEAPNDAHGKGNAGQIKTTNQNDYIYIGYTGFNHWGHLNRSWGDGDFERDYHDGHKVWELNTGKGDDLVKIYEDQNAYTVTKLGDGNDTYHIGGKLDSNLLEALNNDDARSFVFGGKGDDAFTVGGTVDGGRIFAGAGSDKVHIEGEVDDGGVIDLGSGKTDDANGHAEATSADDANAVNNLRITGNLGEIGTYDYGKVLGGAGKDNVTVDYAMRGVSVIDLGGNDDEASVKYMKHNSKIITEDGNDNVTVIGSLFEYSSINTAGEVVAGKPDEFINEVIVPGTPAKTDNDYIKVGHSTFGNSSIEAGDGYNIIDIGDDVDSHSTISAGKHRDILNIGDDIEQFGKVNLGEGDNEINVGSTIKEHAIVDTGDGNDALNVGYVITNHSHINLGNGNNVVTIGDDLEGHAILKTGNGDDKVNIGDDTEHGAVMELGDGNNEINIASTIEDKSSITTGTGDDILNVGYSITNFSKVNLGDGNNVITTGDDIDGYAMLTTGDGNDRLTIGDDTENAAVVSLGGGDDVVKIADTVEDSSSVLMGSGNDHVTIGGLVECDTKVDGGLGQDTLTFTFDANHSMVNAWKHITTLSSKNIRGFETIEMDGINAIDIRFEDLLHDTSRDGALFVKGNENSKVDLGSTNWNSDNADKASMKDASGGTWTKTGTETVDNVSYDIYHNSLATNNLNDVYIEQGVVVI